jgi:hypothetical protein
MAPAPFAVRYLLTGACINLDQLRWQYWFNPKALAMPTPLQNAGRRKSLSKGRSLFFHEKKWPNPAWKGQPLDPSHRNDLSG